MKTFFEVCISSKNYLAPLNADGVFNTESGAARFETLAEAIDAAESAARANAGMYSGEPTIYVQKYEMDISEDWSLLSVLCSIDIRGVS